MLVDAFLVLLNSGECSPRAPRQAGENSRREKDDRKEKERLPCIKPMGAWYFHEKFPSLSAPAGTISENVAENISAQFKVQESPS